jgi:hypothetical protein
MSTTPHRPGGHTDVDLLVHEDLPVGWCLPGTFPRKLSHDASGEIDALLGYDHQTVTDGERVATLDVEQNETVDGRWCCIEHARTKTRVRLRLQRQVSGETRISGVVYLPGRPGDPITRQLLRELPTARIEAAINARLFAVTRTNAITGGKIELPSGRKMAERDQLNPLSDPKLTPAGTADVASNTSPRQSRQVSGGPVNVAGRQPPRGRKGVTTRCAQARVARRFGRASPPSTRQDRALHQRQRPMSRSGASVHACWSATGSG